MRLHIVIASFTLLLCGCQQGGGGGQASAKGSSGSKAPAAVSLTSPPTTSGTGTTSTTNSAGAPAGLRYDMPTSFRKGTAISPILPRSSGGKILAYYAFPPLPNGLLLNQDTGAISGVPTAISAYQSYSILGKNDVGVTYANISVQVEDVAPSPYFPRSGRAVLEARSLALGDKYSCAAVNGGVQCWGSGLNFLDARNYSTNYLPMKISGMNGTLSLAAGERTLCEITGEGANCWGSTPFLLSNFIGGALPDILVQPSLLPSSNGIQALALGQSVNSCVIRNDRVECPEKNAAGKYQLQPKSGLFASAKSLAVGRNYACALLVTEEVWCWGDTNFFGVLGARPADLLPSVPHKIAGLRGPIKSVAAGTYHACALLESGAIQCWGDNSKGELGNGQIASNPTLGSAIANPVDVLGINSATQISLGSQYSCALLAGGGVKCWGLASSGQLGHGGAVDLGLNPGYSVPLPTTVVGLGGPIREIAAATDHACAISTANSIQCWGSAFQGQLGDGGYVNSSTPVLVRLER